MFTLPFPVVHENVHIEHVDGEARQLRSQVQATSARQSILLDVQSTDLGYAKVLGACWVSSQAVQRSLRSHRSETSTPGIRNGTRQLESSATRSFHAAIPS